MKHLTGHLARNGNSTIRNVGHSPVLSVQPPSWKAPRPTAQSPGFTEEGTEVGGEKRGGGRPWTPRRPRPSPRPLARRPQLPRGEALHAALPGSPGSARPGRGHSTCRQAPAPAASRPPAARGSRAPGLRGSGAPGLGLPRGWQLGAAASARTQLFTLPKVPTPSVSPST